MRIRLVSALALLLTGFGLASAEQHQDFNAESQSAKDELWHIQKSL